MNGEGKRGGWGGGGGGGGRGFAYDLATHSLAMQYTQGRGIKDKHVRDPLFSFSLSQCVLPITKCPQTQDYTYTHKHVVFIHLL